MLANIELGARLFNRFCLSGKVEDVFMRGGLVDGGVPKGPAVLFCSEQHFAAIGFSWFRSCAAECHAYKTRQYNL